MNRRESQLKYNGMQIFNPDQLMLQIKNGINKLVSKTSYRRFPAWYHFAHVFFQYFEGKKTSFD